MLKAVGLEKIFHSGIFKRQNIIAVDNVSFSGRFAALIRLVEVLSSCSGPYTGARPRFEDTLDAHWMVEPSNRPDQS